MDHPLQTSPSCSRSPCGLRRAHRGGGPPPLTATPLRVKPGLPSRRRNAGLWRRSSSAARTASDADMHMVCTEFRPPGSVALTRIVAVSSVTAASVTWAPATAAPVTKSGADDDTAWVRASSAGSTNAGDTSTVNLLLSLPVQRFLGGVPIAEVAHRQVGLELRDEYRPASPRAALGGCRRCGCADAPTAPWTRRSIRSDQGPFRSWSARHISYSDGPDRQLTAGLGTGATDGSTASRTASRFPVLPVIFRPVATPSVV